MSLDILRKKLVGKFDTKIEKTTPLVDLPENLKLFLNELYQSKDTTEKFFATLLNGIYSDTRLEFDFSFMMSKPLFCTLVKYDQKIGNLNRGEPSGTEYKTFVSLLVNREIIDILNQSEEVSEEFPEGRAGTWKLIDRDAIKLLEKSFPQELDEEGYPYLDEDEMYEQWVNGGHKKYFEKHQYEKWLDQEVSKEKKQESLEESQAILKIVEESAICKVSPKLKFY